MLSTFEQLKGMKRLSQTRLHSEQGFQYISKSYVKQLEQLDIKRSHSRRGNCFDNVCITLCYIV